MNYRQPHASLPRSSTRLILAVLLAVLLAIIPISGAVAQDSNGSAAADIAAGQRYFYTCTGCHGIPGYNNVYPTYKVPMIGGQNELYIINALKAYKNGTREHETMQVQAESMSEQDIINVAAYLASMNSKESS